MIRHRARSLLPGDQVRYRSKRGTVVAHRYPDRVHVYDGKRNEVVRHEELHRTVRRPRSKSKRVHDLRDAWHASQDQLKRQPTESTARMERDARLSLQAWLGDDALNESEVDLQEAWGHARQFSAHVDTLHSTDRHTLASSASRDDLNRASAAAAYSGDHELANHLSVAARDSGTNLANPEHGDGAVAAAVHGVAQHRNAAFVKTVATHLAAHYNPAQMKDTVEHATAAVGHIVTASSRPAWSPPAATPIHSGLADVFSHGVYAAEARRHLQEARGKTGNTGAMVALYPPPDVARKLAIPGGEDPDDMHLTLAFLGKADDMQNPLAVRAVVQALAKTTSPVSGSVAGHGVFTHGADAPVTYASVDSPQLPQLHGRLHRMLNNRANTPPSAQHGFTPHMTLAYADRKPRIPATPITFDRISLIRGDDREDFPFTGHLQESALTEAAGIDWKSARPGDTIRYQGGTKWGKPQYFEAPVVRVEGRGVRVRDKGQGWHEREHHIHGGKIVGVTRAGGLTEAAFKGRRVAPREVAALRGGDLVRVSDESHSRASGTLIAHRKRGKNRQALVHVHATNQLHWFQHSEVTHARKTTSAKDRLNHLRLARMVAQGRRSGTQSLQPHDPIRRDAASHARITDKALSDAGGSVSQVSAAASAAAVAPDAHPSDRLVKSAIAVANSGASVRHHSEAIPEAHPRHSRVGDEVRYFESSAKSGLGGGRLVGGTGTGRRGVVLGHNAAAKLTHVWDPDRHARVDVPWSHIHHVMHEGRSGREGNVQRLVGGRSKGEALKKVRADRGRHKRLTDEDGYSVFFRSPTYGSGGRYPHGGGAFPSAPGDVLGDVGAEGQFDGKHYRDDAPRLTAERRASDMTSEGIHATGGHEPYFEWTKPDGDLREAATEAA